MKNLAKSAKKILDRIAIEERPTSIRTIQTIILDCNGLNTDRRQSTGVKLAFDYLNAISSLNQINPTDIISGILKYAFGGNLTESQAYVLARYAVENEIEL